MPTIRDYLDIAKRCQGLPSDRQLSRKLGLHPGSVCQFRLGRALPSSRVMIRICQEAGLDVETGLCDLNIWRERQDPVARKHYECLKQLYETVR